MTNPNDPNYRGDPVRLGGNPIANQQRDKNVEVTQQPQRPLAPDSNNFPPNPYQHGSTQPPPQQPPQQQPGHRYVGTTPPPEALLDSQKQKEEQRRFEVQQKIQQSFQYFERVFNDKTLVSQKSQSQRNSEIEASKSLLSATQEAGDFAAVGAVMFKLLLDLRDRANYLEASNKELAREILVLKGQLSEETTQPEPSSK